MSFYTITDNTTNEILSTFETGLPELVALQVELGQSIHEGFYPPDQYTYDGTEFIELVSTTTKELGELPDRNIILTMLKELRKQGYSFPSLNINIQTKSQAYSMVNLAVSRACERYVSQGKFIPTVYALKEQDIKVWRDNGSDEANPPELLSSWFDHGEDAQGLAFTTYDEAATSIENQAGQMRYIIETTERIRLEARKAIAASTEQNLQTVMQGFIDTLEAV